MLSYAEKEAYVKFIAEIYADMEDELIEKLAYRLRDTEGVSDMAKWQIQKLVELGAYNKENAAIIARYSGKSQQAVEKIFTQAGYDTLQGDMTIYELAFGKGLIPYLPQNSFASAAIQQILSASIANTRSYLNLVNTTAYKGINQQYNRIVSTAYLQTATGLTDLSSAVRNSVRKLAEKGITAVTYNRKDGKVVNYPIDAAVKMSIRTSISQTAGKLQMQMAVDLGCNYVEVTSHLGARPEHAKWQGRVYQINGSSREYPNLVEATGYGSVTGLHGVNCRHDFYPFFPGIDARASHPYDLKENEKEYRLTQEQRRLENEVRKARRQCAASNALGDKAQFTADSVKLKRRESELKNFMERTGRTQTARVQTHGFDRSVSQKTVHVYKNSLRQEELTNEKNRAILKEKISNGEITLTLNPDKQNPHIFGSDKYDPAANKSYFTISLEDIQKIVNDNYATGTVIIKPNGQIKEVIKLPSDLGVVINDKGNSVGATNRMTVHYSKSRTHVVPARKDEKNGN